MSTEPSRPWVKDAAFVGVALTGVVLCGLTLRGEVSVGDTLGFAPDYAALLAAMTSEYVEKVSLSGSW